MKRLQLQQNSPEWLEWRKGRITGSRLGDIIVKRGTGRKLGFYEVLAERLSIDTSDVDSPMDRGHDLEEEALALFGEITGKEVKTDCGVWMSDENEFIAISPDGEINDEEAVEIKCLSSARHLQAYFEQKIPSDYEEQVAQYFIVNEKLKALWFVFYDPRIPSKPLHYILVNRKDIEKDIETYKTYEKQALEEINKMINQLTF